jgi:hypothetical protein
MKKLLLIVLISISFTRIYAQQGFIFKIKYLPNRHYTTMMQMDMNMDMDFKGDSAILEKIKASGTKVPMAMTNSTKMEMSINTGALKPANAFPITFNYSGVESKVSVNGDEKVSPPSPIIGQTIYGEYTTDGKMRLDSISGKIDDQLKQTVMAGITNLLNQMKFPDKPMSIGETFNQEVPFSLPVAGMNMSSTIKIVYKLISVDKNSAYFDTIQSMDFDVNTEKDGVKMIGKGKGAGDGKLVYNLAQGFATEMTSNLGFDLTMNVSNITIIAKAKMVSINKTTIENKGK